MATATGGHGRDVRGQIAIGTERSCRRRMATFAAMVTYSTGSISSIEYVSVKDQSEPVHT